VIAEQYFCEKKVEMKHIHGRIETESKQQGSEGHETLLLGSVQADRTQILKEIFEGGYVICQEFPLMARYSEILLAGIPDAVVFQGGAPILILEFKFSNSPFPYPSYHAQARVYGIMLDHLGFDVSNLFYSLAIIPRDRRGDDMIFRKILSTVIDDGLNESVLKVDGAAVYVCKYDRIVSEHDLDWALGFWKGTRSALPTENMNKCRNCEYNALCDRAV
jgi:hypothetical protein